MEENLGENNVGQMSAGNKIKPRPFIMITSITVTVALLLILLFLWQKALIPGLSLAPTPPQVLTEGEKLEILNQLNSGGGSIEDRQSAVNKLSGSAPVFSLEEKQKILDDLVGQK